MADPHFSLLSIDDREDAPELVALINLAYRGNGGEGRWTSESQWVSGERIDRSQLCELLESDRRSLLVARLDERIVACIATSEYDDYAEFGTFAVAEDQQGRGLGKRLLAHAEALASPRFRTFQVSVLDCNEALLRFYLKRGYRPTGLSLSYPPRNDVGQPKIDGIALRVLRKTRPHD